MVSTLGFGLWGIVVAMACYVGLQYYPRSEIPAHLLSHPVVFQEHLVARNVGKSLLRHMKDISVFPSNIAADLKTAVKVTTNEEIGEGQPLDAAGGCEHPYLTPNMNKTLCVLPQRVDVGRAFVMTGGVDGLKENAKTMISRTSSFGQYNIFNSSELPHPAVDALFRSAKFTDVAESVCPKHRQKLDPFQFNFIINVPGQSVPLHLDAPTFSGGATRKNYPQWLLVAMVFSGFFKEKYIDTVQVVAYLHEWYPTKAQMGDFVFYREDSSRFKMFPALPLAGTGVDGAKTIHAARTYMPQTSMPHLDKNKHSELVYKGGESDEWNLLVDGEVVETYTTNDLRISIVYRARCFESQDDLNDFHHNQGAGSVIHPDMTLDKILGVFLKDLIERNLLSEEGSKTISRLDLSLLIIDTYIRYPLPDASVSLIPYNVCALGQLVPALDSVLSIFCT